jgi:hypothetical protein
MIALLIKNLSKIIFYILLLGTMVQFSCQYDKVGWKNFQNSQQIKIGMSSDSIISIMGEPKSISDGNKFLNYPETFQVYSYENSSGSSDDIHIVVDTTNRIINIHSSD